MASDQRRFDELLRILDSELRIITPTDPTGDALAMSSDSSDVSATATRYYQLTHDYLVPSLREWLTRKQKETRRGRAELLLAERCRNVECQAARTGICRHCGNTGNSTATNKKNWSEPQRNMMRTAGPWAWACVGAPSGESCR